MTALGILYPGHFAEDDYPRIEQLLGSDVRVDLVHTDAAARGPADPLAPTGEDPLSAGVEELRLSGVEAVVWACAGGGYAPGWDDAREQARTLAVSAGVPASSTAVGLVHAVRELGARRVAVGSTDARDAAPVFADFLRTAGLEVVSVHAAPGGTAGEVAGWGEPELLALARAADHPDAQVLVLPDPALHTAAHLTALERELGKPVLTANQVAVWEALRLTDRRVNAPRLGTLFTREPLVQV